MAKYLATLGKFNNVVSNHHFYLLSSVVIMNHFFKHFIIATTFPQFSTAAAFAPQVDE